MLITARTIFCGRLHAPSARTLTHAADCAW